MNVILSTRQILIILLILSWIIFVGISIDAGGLIVNAIFAIAKPSVVPHLWKSVDLTALFNYDRGWFAVIVLVMAIVAMIKAWLFYRIIKMLSDKNLSLAQPFRQEVRRFIFYISCLALMIGVISTIGTRYIDRLVKEGVEMPDTQLLHLGGADVWLFMAVILFVIGQIFKRGIEIQTENELTV